MTEKIRFEMILHGSLPSMIHINDIVVEVAAAAAAVAVWTFMG